MRPDGEETTALPKCLRWSLMRRQFIFELWPLVALLAFIGCRSEPNTEGEIAAGVTTHSPYLNLRPGVAYVGSEACASCHGDLYSSFQTHGMANSYYPMGPEVAVEEFTDAAVYHERSDLWYRMYREGERFYQEEYRLASNGDTTHSLVREIEYVVGSGTAARTYLTESDNRLYEMPATWYTQAGRWDFSPGYETSNSRFNRLIPDRCMACHNSYPESVEFVEGKYTDVPLGIGCERCHGPGELHVNARLESPEVGDTIDYTIVNPAHLSLDRRLDVCQQCHLNGDISLLREGEEPFSYRPSEPLAAHIAIFSAAGQDEAGIGVISHARRMKMSPCFRGSLALGDPLECTTCHDPHEGFRARGAEYFNNTCKNCHGLPELRATFDTEEARALHTADANCFSCHMPKVEAEDAPHSSFTDHFIRVVSDDVEVEPSPEGAVLVPYFEKDEEGLAARRYEGVAYVVYGTRNNDEGAYRRGIELLEEALARDAAHGNAQFLLGFAHMQLGDLDDAVPHLEQAVQLDPGVPERLNALARAYELSGGDPERIEQLYARALAIQPALADVRVNYGRFMGSEGRLQEAAYAYETAGEEKPWLATAHYNLGTAYLQLGRVDDGEAALRQALTLNPDYPEALGNLGSLYAQQGRAERALELFLHAVEAAPGSAVAHGNLATFYVNEGSARRAVPALREAIALDPGYITAHANLALAYFRLGQMEEARSQARRTLRIAPGNALARQILQALESPSP